MEEREEEYQRARERIFAHDVRAVCVGGEGRGGVEGGGVCVCGGGHVAQIFVSFLFMCKFTRFLANNYHGRIFEIIDGEGVRSDFSRPSIFVKKSDLLVDMYALEPTVQWHVLLTQLLTNCSIQQRIFINIKHLSVEMSWLFFHIIDSNFPLHSQGDHFILDRR